MSSPILEVGSSTPVTIPDPPSVQLRINQTLFVDPINGNDALGQRGTDIAFATLANAISAASNGDTIVMRPGTYSAGATINKSVVIEAFGAKIVSTTLANMATLSITASGTIVRGLEMDGGYPGAGASTSTGAIGVAASNVTLDQCYIQRSWGNAIRMTSDWSGLSILRCRLESNSRTGVSGATATASINGFWIIGCKMSNNGLSGTAPGGIRMNAALLSSFYITGGRIIGNRVSGTSSSTGLGIEVFGGHKRFAIMGNDVDTFAFGISVDHSYGGTINGNNCTTCLRGIELAASQDISVTGNSMDGTNPAGGNPVMVRGIVASSTDDLVKNVTISGNTITNIAPEASDGVGIHVESINNALIASNTITSAAAEAAIRVKQATDIKVISNKALLTATNAVIGVDGGASGCDHILIEDNTFRGSGSKFISLVATQPFPLNDISIVGNTIPEFPFGTPSLFFPSGTISQTLSGGGTLTNLRVHRNSPYHVSGQFGWVNTSQNEPEVRHAVDGTRWTTPTFTGTTSPGDTADVVRMNARGFAYTTDGQTLTTPTAAGIGMASNRADPLIALKAGNTRTAIKVERGTSALQDVTATTVAATGAITGASAALTGAVTAGGTGFSTSFGNVSAPNGVVSGFDGVFSTVTIGTGGDPVTKVLTETPSLSWPGCAAQNSADVITTVTGAAVGDMVNVTGPQAMQFGGCLYTAWVSAADTVTVRQNNYSAGAFVATGPGTFRVTVVKF